MLFSLCPGLNNLSVSTQDSFSKWQLRFCLTSPMDRASSGTRTCMSTNFVFSMSPGASQMQNLRQVPHKMICNIGLLLPSDSGSALYSRNQQ